MTQTNDDHWREIAKGLLKGELKRQNLTYEDLAKRLEAIGISENEASIRNKISRGTFPATFLLQSLAAIGVELTVIRPTLTVKGHVSPELLRGFENISPELLKRLFVDPS